MFKKFATTALGTLILAGMALVATPAQAHSSHGHYYHSHHMHAHKSCKVVRVKSRYAWLKAGASLKSKTLRHAYQGEPLWLVRNVYGRVHHANGMYLVRRANGYRYWVHHSVVRCSH